MDAQPKTGRRLLIAWEKGADQEAIRAAILASGVFDIVGETESQSEAVALAALLAPDVVLIGAVLSEGNGCAAAREILSRKPIPVIMLTAILESAIIDVALDMGVCGYLTLPIEASDLSDAIITAIARFATLQSAMQEAADLREALAMRKLVERTKGILRQRRSLSESADAMPQELQEMVAVLVACRARRRRQGFDD